MLLAKARSESGLDVDAPVLPGIGYPSAPSVLEDTSSIVIFTTGNKAHFLNSNLDAFDTLMKKGVGVVMIHRGTEAVKGEPGEMFLDWMGGFCDLDWSVNPHWKAHFDSFAEHPISNGVKPFCVDEERYYHMRFREDMAGVTSIFADLPGPEILQRPDGERSGNPEVRRSVAAGEEHRRQRPDGGRGFGFTGGHFHQSWQNDEYRKIVLNAILWTTKVEVPVNGLGSKTSTDEELLQNLDPTEKRVR